MIITRTPFRITLGGGGTDLPSFYKKHGGFVTTMAIDKYIYVTLKKNVLDEMVRLQYLQTELVWDAKALKHDRAREALLLHNLRTGLEITSIADLPAQSGLGSSGSYLVGLLTAIRHHKRLVGDPQIVAEEACSIEIETLGEPVGKQDQYIASFGGIQTLEIDTAGHVKVSRVKIGYTEMMEFISNIQIYYLGVSRSASNILKVQNELSPEAEKNLLEIKEMGYKFLECLEMKKFDEYGMLLDEYWNKKKMLSKKISINKVDDVYSVLKTGYGVLGGKIIGAGGGGFLLIYAPKKKEEIEIFMKAQGLKRVHFQPDYTGSKVITDLATSYG